MGERRGRLVPTSYDLQITGLLSVLIKGRQNGLIKSVKPLVDQLIKQADFRVSDQLYKTILDIAGE
ncbi:MAG: DUF3368 domain-containing protein [Cuspidothrix sp.]